MFFKDGDRVVLLEDNPDGNPSMKAGLSGTVVDDMGADGDRSDSWVSVCWDEEVSGGHDCGGLCDHRYGWNVDRSWIELIAEREVVDDDIANLAEICSFIGIPG